MFQTRYRLLDKVLLPFLLKLADGFNLTRSIAFILHEISQIGISLLLIIARLSSRSFIVYFLCTRHLLADLFPVPEIIPIPMGKLAQHCETLLLPLLLFHNSSMTEIFHVLIELSQAEIV